MSDKNQVPPAKSIGEALLKDQERLAQAKREICSRQPTISTSIGFENTGFANSVQPMFTMTIKGGDMDKVTALGLDLSRRANDALMELKVVEAPDADDHPAG